MKLSDGFVDSSPGLDDSIAPSDSLPYRNWYVGFMHVGLICIPGSAHDVIWFGAVKGTPVSATSNRSRWRGVRNHSLQVRPKPSSTAA